MLILLQNVRIGTSKQKQIPILKDKQR